MTDHSSSANEWTPYLTGTLFSPSTISEGWLSSCNIVSERNIPWQEGKKTGLQAVTYLQKEAGFPLSVSLEDGPGGCFSSFWEAIRISYSRQDWTLAQLAGLGTKDPQGEVPCLSSQWMLALTLDHFSVSFLYLGSFGWSLRSVLSFTSALMTGLSCLAASPRGPWCSMGPAYSKTEREQPVVSSQRNGDKSASVSRVFLFWSLGSCFF